MESGCSNMSHEKAKDRTRRGWTQKEEHELISVMKELVANGWKGDNGFRPGYLAKVESEMLKVFPSSDLRANPHINSKLTAWKKYYSLITTMLLRTGVGFDEKTNTIETTDEEWKEAVKADKANAILRHKSWPMFKYWQEIFGKDRATGEHAEDVMEAVNDLIKKGTATNAEKLPDANTPAETSFEEVEVNSIADAEKSANRGRTSRKKRPRTDGIGSGNEQLHEFLQSYCRTTEERMDNIARGIGCESALGKARKEVFNMLGNMTDLTLDEMLDASHMLSQSVPCLEMFMGLPEHAKARYVRRLLAGEFAK